jgi:phosphoserine aminotransferase
MMERAYNFSAGPAMLPFEVMEEVSDGLLNWNNTGMSVMAMPHRGLDFGQIAAEAESNLRLLLNIPKHYKVLFLAGGARSQFSMVPMNFLQEGTTAAYCEFGYWSQLATQEASRFGDVKVIADTSETGFKMISSQDYWLDHMLIGEEKKPASYLFITDNETVNGVEYSFVPNAKGVPLIADMSSNLLTRNLVIGNYGMIFASAQKNIGPAGVTIVIMDEKLFERQSRYPLPSMYDYRIHAEKGSLFNTPATFSWYVVGRVLNWMRQKENGIEYFEKSCQRKAKKLYDYIDSEKFYINNVDKGSRSRINIIFRLANDGLTDTFVEDAAEVGLLNLRGHRVVGGIRVSLYNSMPEEAVDCLIDFMKDFVSKKG